MICKHWNKKKLTTLVCAGMMARTLLPCGTVSADEVKIDKVYEDGTSLPAGAEWVNVLKENDGIALLNSGDTLVLDFGNSDTWYKSFYGSYSNASDTISNYHLVLKSGSIYRVYGGFSSNGAVTKNTVTISGGTLVRWMSATGWNTMSR